MYEWYDFSMVCCEVYDVSIMYEVYCVSMVYEVYEWCMRRVHAWWMRCIMVYEVGV